MGWLDDHVALVTGAGSGIGAAITRRFVEEGARVLAFDLSGERLMVLQHDLGDCISIVTGDVRSSADNQRAVNAAVAQFGRLNVFIGNAGIFDGMRKLGDLSEDELDVGFDEVFGVNVRGYLVGAQAAMPALRRSKGNIIFTLSTSSFYVGGGGPLYVAAKHATLGIMRALAHELAPDIRVNGVAPSGTPTALASAPSLTASATAAGGGGLPVAGLPSSNLLQVAVQPEDHVGAYVLLASPHARLITGTVIHSDGGRGVTGPRFDKPA